VFRIVSAVRRAVPAGMPVSAKMRLGFNDDRLAEDCARAIEAAGADELVVHARTKVHGYKPPAYWERVADLRAVVRLPMVANGEIWTVEDARRCREASGCESLMLGRGMVSDPGLALAIRGGAGIAWSALLPLMLEFWLHVSRRVEPRHRAGRLKQWLNYLRRTYPEAQATYDAVRTLNDPRAVAAAVFGDEAARVELPKPPRRTWAQARNPADEALA
jgi:tRNA-dihydrouridine synthase C